MTRPKVLVLDDDRGARGGLRRLLRTLGDAWDMHFYSSPDQALGAAKNEVFDFIVSEMDSSRLDALALLDEMRRRHPGMVRVLLSGDNRQVAKLRMTGVAHHFVDASRASEDLDNAVKRAGSLRKDLRSERVIGVISETRSLPTVPSLYNRLVAELRSEDPSLAEIGGIVAQDPAMTAQILQIINSAYFGMRRRVGDVRQAVALLGVNTIMALVLSSHLFRQHHLTRRQRSYVESLWRRSVGVAQLSRALAMMDVSTRGLAEEAYLAGILNGCGKLVFATNWPDEFLDSTPDGLDIRAERAAFGADHAFVGGYLMASWDLPDGIVEAVAYHHQPSLCEAGGTPILAAVHVAQALLAQPDLETSTLDTEYVSRGALSGSVEDWKAVASELGYEQQCG